MGSGHSDMERAFKEVLNLVTGQKNSTVSKNAILAGTDLLCTKKIDHQLDVYLNVVLKSKEAIAEVSLSFNFTVARRWI